MYGISPLYTLQEVGYHQQQENLKNNYVKFHNDLGTQFLYVEQFNAARNEFNQVLKVDPLNQNATRGLSECDVYSQTNNTSYNSEITKMRLDAIAKENQNDPLPYLYLGDFFLVRKRVDDASYYYQQAINRDSSIAAAYFGIGVVYDKQNKPDLALKMFHKAVNLSYWNVQFRNNLAYEFYKLGDYQEALNWYSSSVTLDPRHLALYIGYSNSFRCLDDLENAIICQKQQIFFLEDNSTANLPFNQMEIYIFTNSGDIISLYDNDEKKYYFYYNIALTYYLLGNEAQTLEYLKKANDLHVDEDSKSNIKKIVVSDIEILQKAQPKYSNKTIEFTNKFVSVVTFDYMSLSETNFYLPSIRVSEVFL